MSSRESIMLEKLPFYWRVKDAPVENGIVPGFLPFELSFEEKAQLIIQKRNAKVMSCLERVYHEASNVGYLQEDHALAADYGNDFLNFIFDHVTVEENKLITEIGCGGLYILKQLKDKGYDVLGVDPSPCSGDQGNKNNITVIRDFYPSKKLVKKSDLVIHYDVLEHVEDPVGFIRHHHHDLNAGGKIVFGVPDCSEYIKYGDISMVLHEHLNYFDHESLRKVVELAGFEVLEIRRAEHGGVLFCAAKKIENSFASVSGCGDEKMRRFVSKNRGICKRLKEYGHLVRESKGRLGFYVPLRMLPYMPIMGWEENCRFFDDDSGLHRRYFDGYPIPIENFDDLRASPVTHLIIGSFSFGDKIRLKIENAINYPIDVKTLKDFV